MVWGAIGGILVNWLCTRLFLSFLLGLVVQIWCGSCRLVVLGSINPSRYNHIIGIVHHTPLCGATTVLVRRRILRSLVAGRGGSRFLCGCSLLESLGLIGLVVLGGIGVVLL